MVSAFALHPRLVADTRPLGRLPLSLLLLMNEASCPWVILVPERPALRELYELAEADRVQLMAEIALVSRAMADAFRPDKLNVASLGNVVEQLHVHVVARYRGDPAWPGPLWGHPQLRAGDEVELAARCSRLLDRLASMLR